MSRIFKPKNNTISLLTTLGSEPQVVTTALDLLLRKNLIVKKVFIFHTDPNLSPISIALPKLKTALSVEAYPNLQIEFVPIKSEGSVVDDFTSPKNSQSFFKTFYEILWFEKKEGNYVHVCPAGGRKTMAMYAMAAAQLLFEETDRFWHLFSGGQYLESKRMHPKENDDTQLVEIPVTNWGDISPVVSVLKQISDPFLAVQKVRELGLQRKISKAKEFFESDLTPAQQNVVRLLVKEGCADNQIAKNLCISSRTVERHLSDVYLKATTYWEFEERVNRTQLIALLKLFLSTELSEITHDKA